MILLFSGTGNSLHVANLLSKGLGDDIVKLPTKEELTANERVIWVFPVYSWGLPPVVRRWIETMEIQGASSGRHYAVMTCGDDIGNADKMWRRAISERGWKPAGAFSVQMPNTYVLMKGFDVDSEPVAEEKVAKSAERVGEIVRAISSEPDAVVSDVVRGSFPWIKTNVIYPYFVRFDMSPKPFHNTEECIGCGSCAKLCPMENILMAGACKGHVAPVWGDNCALCLGCYHICPHHAVAYGRITAKKGQKKVLKN